MSGRREGGISKKEQDTGEMPLWGGLQTRSESPGAKMTPLPHETDKFASLPEGLTDQMRKKC